MGKVLKQDLERVYLYLKALGGIEWSDLLALKDQIRRETYSSRTEIFKEGDLYRRVDFILRGLVKKYYLTEDGKEFIKEFAFEGQSSTPYASILTNTPATYTMEALEETEVLSIEYNVIEDLMMRDVRWLRIAKRLADLHFLNREERERELLKFSASERYAIFRRKFPILLGRLKKQDIAAYLGITPVSLSRLESEQRE